MKIKTANKINIHDKPKVLFVSYPSDFAQYFEIISNDILSLNDCAIYYYEFESDIQETDWQSNLLEMNLIVIPITDKFLCEDNAAMNIYLFAQKKSIPVLPIVVERGLERKFNSVCGERQFLDRTDNDPTSIPYTKKLEDYLSAVLVGDELSKKVRAAFDAYVFLSYRKKDRKYAQDLMHTIHNNEFTKSVAIWYDEFLQPNEDFNDSIRKALLKSDLFALAVTPNLVNEKNYVISDEYPVAVDAKKRILPVELIETDKTLLYDRDHFPNLPECINIKDTNALSAVLMESLSHIVKQKSSKDPNHNYYIGIAYLHGIDVEIDREKGIELISSAAERGVLEATKELVKMYYYGYFVKKDFSKSVYWQKNLIIILQKNYSNNPTANTAIDLADALRFLTEIERNSIAENQNLCEMISNCKKAMEICDHVNLTDEESKSRFVECKLNTLRALAILYEMSEDYDNALTTYITSLEIRKVLTVADESLEDSEVKILDKWRLAQLHHDIGIMYRKKGDFKSAVSELFKSIEIYEKISKETPDYLSHEAAVREELAYDATFIDVGLAEKQSVQAVEICKNLCNKDPELYELNYADSLLNHSAVLTELGSSDFDEIEKLCHNAELIYEKHIDSASFNIIFNYINALYKLAGVNRKKFVLNTAEEYYKKASDFAVSFLSSASPEPIAKITLAHLLFDYGTFLTIDANEEKLVKSIEYLKKALSLFEMTGNIGRKFIDETKETIAKIQNWLDEYDAEPATNGSVSNDIKKALFNFQYFLGKGDEAEKEKNYEKAHLMYKSAWDQLMIIEDINGPVDTSGKVDVLDRLAVSCEMSNELRMAKLYYTMAADISYEEAKKTIDNKMIELCNWTLQKVIAFCDDYGYEIGARIYRNKLDEITKMSSSDDGVQETIDLPDGKGNTISFKILDIVEYRQNKYTILAPASIDVISYDSLLILKLKTNSNGELEHVDIVKSSLIKKVYEVFKSNNINRYTFSD